MRIQTAALIGSYVPRKCGIGTFTKDLNDSISAEGNVRTLVLAMDDTPSGYDYPDEVRFQIQANHLKDYRVAADMLNINQVDVAIVEHEFGIFGGRSGERILALMRRLRMPVITTLHTVLSEPNNEQRVVMNEIINYSDRLVVLCNRAAQMLKSIYNTPDEKIVYIPHGIPDVPFVDPTFYKDQFGLEGKSVLLTFGLLSPNKGLEVALNALPRIVSKHPDVTYLILGAIHPDILRKDGNAYMIFLERTAEKLGVREHVLFHNRYVTLEELCSYLGAADIFLTPYKNKEQIVSGTLAYAMGAGKAVVSTPYWYAEEMLAEERGRLFPFGDSEALGNTICDLLADPTTCAAMRKRAYVYCRNMVWKEVARQYLDCALSILRERAKHPAAAPKSSTSRYEIAAVPEFRMDHMLALTDDTGILQHAVYSVPDRRHGYTTDDNARALVASMMHYETSGDMAILDVSRKYLAFLHHAFDEQTKRFRNYLTYDRKWEDRIDSDDANGRAIWGLGITAALAPNEATLALSSRLFQSALEGIESVGSVRSWAFALVGIHSYLKRFSGDSHVRRVRETLARRLYAQFEKNAAPDWQWYDDTVTYDNGKLPHALILSGQWLFDHKILQQGIKTLEWLVSIQTDKNGRVSLIGNDGWMTRGGQRARFDQQPLEAMSMVEACVEAYRYTKDTKWRTNAEIFLGWFLGNNDIDAMLYDPATGGCRDGLHPNGSNLNEGAESTLAWLIALLTVNQLYRESETGVPVDVSESDTKNQK